MAGQNFHMQTFFTGNTEYWTAKHAAGVFYSERGVKLSGSKNKLITEEKTSPGFSIIGQLRPFTEM